MAGRNPRPRLVQVGNLWTLLGHPSPRHEWSLDRKLRAIKEARFDAVTVQANAQHRALLRQYNLRLMGYFSSSLASEFRELIRSQKEAGAEHINVQLGDHDTSPGRATQLAVRLIREGNRQKIPCYVEIHRDTATETPEKVRALATGYRKATGTYLPITWDHSHLAIIKHMRPEDYSRRLLQPKRLHQMTPLFHCRPFNGHHCQVPVTNGRGRLTPEFKDWLIFVQDLFSLWLSGPRPGNEIWVCPEIGPVPGGYNLSSFPDSWSEAILCRKHIEAAWKRALKAAA